LEEAVIAQEEKNVDQQQNQTSDPGLEEKVA
jgi:hypothetical protein